MGDFASSAVRQALGFRVVVNVAGTICLHHGNLVKRTS